MGPLSSIRVAKRPAGARAPALRLDAAPAISTAIASPCAMRRNSIRLERTSLTVGPPLAVAVWHQLYYGSLKRAARVNSASTARLNSLSSRRSRSGRGPLHALGIHHGAVEFDDDRIDVV